MTDERLGQATGQWLRDIDTPAQHPQASVQRAMVEVARTDQVRRWWPMRHPPRISASPTPLPTEDYSPPPFSATNGHSPIVRGRTRSMLSPAKAIAVTALAIGVGGVMLIARPIDGPPDMAPGAATDTEPIAPVVVTAAIRPGPEVAESSTSFEEVPGRVERRGTVWAPTITASDPRLEGRVTQRNDQDQYPGPDGPESFVLGTSTMRIENDEGAWQGSNVYFLVAEEGGAISVVLVGEGAYEGLYAVLDLTDWSAIRGVVFPAPPPPAPAAP